jgi:hypothetical protein
MTAQLVLPKTENANGSIEDGLCPDCGAVAINVHGLLDCSDCGY